MSDVKELALPAWAKLGDAKARMAVVIEVDTDAAMTEWMELLDVTSPDQYHVECAYQCAKMDVQKALEGSEFDPRTCGKSAEIHFSRAPEWALNSLPKGKGIELATKGHHARNHYMRVRRTSVPFSA